MADVAFEITGAEALRAMSGELVRIPPRLRAQLRTRMQPPAAAMKTAVQRNALAIPARGDKHTGLRHALAAVTKVDTRVSSDEVTVRIWVDSASMPPGQGKLPALVESPGWTHPIYGHGHAFQWGHPYFQRAIEPLLPTMRAAVDQAVNDATNGIRSER